MREVNAPADFDIHEKDSIVDAVFAHERDDPDFIMFQRLVDESWMNVTCVEAVAEIRSAAKGLIARGIRPGDRIAIFSATCYEWVILDLAILSVGGLPVPIYETSSAEQVHWILKNSGAVFVFAESPGHAGLVEQHRADLPALRDIFIIKASPGGAFNQLANAAKSSDDTALAKRIDELQSSDIATLVYTSGTTGQPKGCQITHSNFLHEIRGAERAFPSYTQKGQRLLVFLPLAHVLTRVMTLTAVRNKVTVGFHGITPNLTTILMTFRPTIIVAVPRIFEKIYDTAERRAVNLGKSKVFAAAVRTAIEYSQCKGVGRASLLLKIKHTIFDKLVYRKLRDLLGGQCDASVSGGAPLSTKLCHFYRGVGIDIYEGYGLTETSAAITVNHVDDCKIGTVGKLLPGNSLRIDEHGEILVRGGVVFCGYWQDDVATAEAITNGWFHTGDLGEIDDDGFLTIVGRKKEIIVTSGGKNVAPGPIEDRLRAYPLISHIMVVGEGKPFIGALITIDSTTFHDWKYRNGKDTNFSVRDLCEDPDLVSDISLAIKHANQAVSKAEQIRKFRILPVDFGQESGELTPTMKMKRNIITHKFSSEIEKIYP